MHAVSAWYKTQLPFACYGFILLTQGDVVNAGRNNQELLVQIAVTCSVQIHAIGAVKDH